MWRTFHGSGMMRALAKATTGRLPQSPTVSPIFGSATRRSLSSLVVRVVAEELRERFRQFTLGALVETVLLLEGLSLSGCVTSTTFCDFRAALVTIGVGTAFGS